MTSSVKNETGTEVRKKVLHRWLLDNDKGYAFECAVMTPEATFAKYSLVELQVRRERIAPSSGASGYSNIQWIVADNTGLS